MLAWFDRKPERSVLYVFIFLALTELDDDARIMLNVTVCHTSAPGAGYTADGGLLNKFFSHSVCRLFL